MKTRHIILSVLAAASVMTFQSCLLEQEDVFEESSSARMQNYLANAQKVLTSCDYWIMDYYPGTGQALGGYSYILTFTDKEVTAAYEREPEESYTSIYKFTTDNGPVISFDSNNEALHYFATPSSSEYEAKGGDFEFSIMKATPEEVILKGKRSANKCFLRPLDKGIEPKDYLTAVANMAGDVHAATFEGTIGGENYPVHGTVDLNKRTLKFLIDTEEVKDSLIATFPFAYTPEGIRGYETACVNGCHFRELNYYSENNILTNAVFTLKCAVPEDYESLANFLGDFNFKYYAGTKKVNISLQEDGSLLIKGIDSHFDVKASYDKAKGRISILYQVVGTNGNNTIAFCPWDANSGYLTWNPEVGMEAAKDMKVEGRYNFVDNGVWEDYICDSFLLYEFDPDGNTVGGYSGWGSYQFPFFEYIERIK